MISPELKQKLAKVYALVNQGATEGERQAAQQALERIIEKYDLHGIDLESLDKEQYYFKYTTWMEESLLIHITRKFCADPTVIDAARKQTYKVRQIKMFLNYMDYITISASYEYFRRHMMVQWRTIGLPLLKKCRKAKTRNNLRLELQKSFFNRYVILSKLIDEKYIEPMTNPKDIEKARKFTGVKGGQYHQQIVGTNLLTQ